MLTKRLWLAIVQPPSGIGYPLDIYAEEYQSWQNWAKRRSQKIIGQFATQRQAREAIETWLAANRWRVRNVSIRQKRPGDNRKPPSNRFWLEAAHDGSGDVPKF
jgi:hypothetical protein